MVFIGLENINKTIKLLKSLISKAVDRIERKHNHRGTRWSLTLFSILVFFIGWSANLALFVGVFA